MNRNCLNGALSLLTLVLFVGCFKDYGAGGTGEMVVPPHTLRDVEPFDLASRATTNASTEPTTFPSTPPPATIELTIEEVRQAALQNNLDLRAQLFNPTIAKEGLTAEQARFESVFTTNVNYARSDNATASQLNSSQAESWNLTPGIQIPLITGGSVQVQAPLSRNETNNQFSTLNPSYSSDLDASISLPLMRGFGIAANAQGIRVAFYQSQSAQAQTKLEVIRVLADAERDYWRLYAAQRERDVRRKEYELAVAQLERARRQVRTGLVAEVEIVRAESGVADTVGAIITVDNVVRDRQRDLKRIMNRPDLGIETPTDIVLTSPPRPTPYKLDPEQLVRQSLADRMEMLQTELQIATQNAGIDAARNNLLPLVTLTYRYGISGLGGEFNDASQQILDKRFEGHSAGLNVEIPLGNQAARSRLRSALANRLQTLVTKQQQILQITQEVYNAVDAIDADWQRILANQKRTVLNARLLDVETRQFDQGLRTSTDVLDAQTKLASAQSAEISAITDYQIAEIDLAIATGTTLGLSRIVWSPAPEPKIR